MAEKQTENSIAITITPAATQKILQATKQEDMKNMALRLAAKIGPEGEIQFGMGFDSERDKDLRIESAGIDILVSHHSRDLLNGVVLDYLETSPQEARFVFFKPGEDGESGDQADSPI